MSETLLFTNAEFYRFVEEAQEQRARADVAEVAVAECRELLARGAPSCLNRATCAGEFCRRVTAILAQPAPERGAALLEAANALVDLLGDADGFVYVIGDNGLIRIDMREVLEHWRALLAAEPR